MQYESKQYFLIKARSGCFGALYACHTRWWKSIFGLNLLQRLVAEWIWHKNIKSKPIEIEL